MTKYYDGPCSLRNRTSPETTLHLLKWFAKYDPETGIFTCIKTSKGRTVPVGQQLGHIQHTTGYRYISIEGNRFSCHALAYLWMEKLWHKKYLDHINGNRDDNRWSNLREVTCQQNMCNTPAAARGGVGFHKASGKWRAYIKIDGKAKHLGLFLTKDEAVAAHNITYQQRLNHLDL